MKWFKHYSDASHDEFLESILDEYGLEGYARWWLILESIASQMDSANKCSVEYSWRKWQTILKGKRNKLETFLKHLENESKIKLEQNGNKLKIECSNLLKIRDNHTKNLQAKNNKVAPKVTPKIKIEDKDKDKDLSENKFSDDDLKCAEYLKKKILEINAKAPSNLDKWADTVRLMVERDGRCHREICEVFNWANNDEFWKANILSAEKLRKQFDTLKLQSERSNGAKNDKLDFDNENWHGI